MASPGPVDYAGINVLTMNMAGRFTGREIKSFGQQVLGHILVEKQVGLFMGQQINFKPTLPDGYGHVGSNKAFLCYNKKELKVNDERQYRHFLRDLHIRGHLPHHYLPDKNYVVMKMRYRHKPWSEFIAMSWMTDERQDRVKNLAHLRKVIYYACHLAEAEEMPVLVGGTFRMTSEDITKEMDEEFLCYGYKPGSARRTMRLSNAFLCFKPMLLDDVRPLNCSKMEFAKHNYARWMNPEDAFYWDPVIASLLMPVQTPESIEEARHFEEKVNNHISQRTMVSDSRPITGISSKHLLISANNTALNLAGRPQTIGLPTAPVLPTPQENPAPPPSSPDETDDCRSFAEAVKLSNSACNLPAIDEVSSEVERQDIYSSDSDTIKTSGSYPVTPSSDQSGHYVLDPETDREEKMFEILEDMMNDKESTFYSGPRDAEMDPDLMEILRERRVSSLEERFRNSEDPDRTPPPTNNNGGPNSSCSQDSNGLDRTATKTDVSSGSGSRRASADTPLSRMTASVPDLSSQLSSEHKTKEILRRAPSCQELYDEELVANSTTCYMS